MPNFGNFLDIFAIFRYLMSVIEFLMLVLEVFWLVEYNVYKIYRHNSESNVSMCGRNRSKFWRSLWQTLIRNVSPNHFKILVKADKFQKLWNLLCCHYFMCGYYEKKLECFAQVCPYSSYESKLQRRSVELRRSCTCFYSMLQTNWRFTSKLFLFAKHSLGCFMP